MTVFACPVDAKRRTMNVFACPVNARRRPVNERSDAQLGPHARHLGVVALDVAHLDTLVSADHVGKLGEGDEGGSSIVADPAGAQCVEHGVDEFAVLDDELSLIHI
mgnify:CR=1 FL=1